MAERRMFSKFVTDSEEFVTMPLSAQALYLHLGMKADDDGFLGNPKPTIRSIGASDSDLDTLIENQFVYQFPSGVVVIRHHNVNNQIKHHTDTMYMDELEQVTKDKRGIYHIAENAELPHFPPVQYSSVKPSVVQTSIDKASAEKGVRGERLVTDDDNLERDDVINGFTDFWEQFDRKDRGDRGPARTAFFKLLEDGIEPVSLLNAYQAWKISPQRLSMTRNQHPSAFQWLNDHLWNDFV